MSCFVQMLFSLVIALFHVAVALTPSERAAEMLSKMDVTEKYHMLHGVEGHYVGNVQGNERLGIPSINMQDGPQGFRTNDRTGGPGTSTAWPSSLTIAASWDEDLLYQWGHAMAEEFKNKGANMMLAPGIGIARSANAGRNFEYLSGEDPVLGAKFGAQVIKGIQDQGLLADAKHFVNNEIEDQRMLVSANVSERAQFELYYPPFQGAVDAGVHTVMCAYNRINAVYACENLETLGVLRETLGFKGFVVSDWTATKSTVQSLHAGLDIEMPFGGFYNEITFSKAIKEGYVSLKMIDESVLRVLTAMYAVGLFDHAPTGDPMANVTSVEHNTLARSIAAQSTVLAKNINNILPLKIAELGDCIAVLGDNSTVSGGGSGHVDPPYVITAEQGVTFALAAAGSNTKVYYSDGKDLNEATALATKCNTAVVVVATTSNEGADRENISLGNGQDELVSAVVAANPRTVVSVITPAAVLMPWADSVPAILISWLPGQEAGNALADVLFGTVNPSGKLPITMPNKENEVGFTQEQYPGTGRPPTAVYTEELLIGYRWYNFMGVKPLFPFGHGLSYTTFQYYELRTEMTAATAGAGAADNKTAAAAVKVDPRATLSLITTIVKNIGAVEGAEVVQLYITYPSTAGEPCKQLKAFKKVKLAPKESKEVTFTLTNRDFSIWNSDIHDWQLVTGTFDIFVGSSVEDVRVTTSVEVA